jgi:hypothetical protein
MSEQIQPDAYVSYREHAELRLRVGALEARLAHLPDQVEKLRDEVRALPALIQAQSPNAAGTALALHRAIDVFSQAPAKGGGSLLDQIARFAGALAIGALSYKLFGDAL